MARQDRQEGDDGVRLADLGDGVQTGQDLQLLLDQGREDQARAVAKPDVRRHEVRLRRYQCGRWLAPCRAWKYLVCPGVRDTLATVLPTSALRMVDLPTLGCPTMPIVITPASDSNRRQCDADACQTRLRRQAGMAALERKLADLAGQALGGGVHVLKVVVLLVVVRACLGAVGIGRHHRRVQLLARQVINLALGKCVGGLIVARFRLVITIFALLPPPVSLLLVLELLFGLPAHWLAQLSRLCEQCVGCMCRTGYGTHGRPGPCGRCGGRRRRR